MKKISFLLSRVFEDGKREEPQIVPVKETMSEDLKLNRRGFLGVGLVASASLLLLDSCAAGKSLSNNCNKGKAHENGVYSLLFVQGGKILISRSSHNEIKLWKIPEGALMKTIDDLKEPKFVGKDPDGNLLITIKEQSTYSCWVLTDQSKRKLFDATPSGGNFTKVIYSPDRRTIICGTEKGKIELRNTKTGALGSVLHAHKNDVMFLEISPDGKFMISAESSNLIVWDFTDYKLLSCMQPQKNIAGLYVCPDGKSFITLNSAGSLEQRSLPNGALIKSVESMASGILEGNASGTLLATPSGSKEIALWSLPDLSLKKNLTGHTGAIEALAVSPDGSLLASGSDDGRIRLWKLPEGVSHACLMDLLCSPDSAKGAKFTTTNEYGQSITYTMPCGSPLPPGATCTCNCVPGAIKTPKATLWGGGGGYRSNCSCNQVCTCVPVYR